MICLLPSIRLLPTSARRGVTSLSSGLACASICALARFVGIFAASAFRVVPLTGVLTDLSTLCQGSPCASLGVLTLMFVSFGVRCLKHALAILPLLCAAADAPRPPRDTQMNLLGRFMTRGVFARALTLKPPSRQPGNQFKSRRQSLLRWTLLQHFPGVIFDKQGADYTDYFFEKLACLGYGCPHVFCGASRPHVEDHGSGCVGHCDPRTVSTPLASAPWWDHQATAVSSSLIALLWFILGVYAETAAYELSGGSSPASAGTVPDLCADCHLSE